VVGLGADGSRQQERQGEREEQRPAGQGAFHFLGGFRS
jgi:hypothetical protein